MSIHFSGVYKLQGHSRPVERRIEELERRSLENFDAPALAFVELNTDDIHSVRANEAQCSAVVLTGQDSRNFCKPLGLEFPHFSQSERQQLLNFCDKNPLLSLETPMDLLKFRLLMQVLASLEPKTPPVLKKADQYGEAKVRLNLLCHGAGPVDKVVDPLNQGLTKVGTFFQNPRELFQKVTQLFSGEAPAEQAVPASAMAVRESSIQKRFTDFYEALTQSDDRHRIQHEQYEPEPLNYAGRKRKAERAMFYHDGTIHFRIDPDAQPLPDLPPLELLKELKKRSEKAG